MTSQGQRFRRRALRRGYKVDEVDLFLDRVEATLNGETGSDAVASQEVHDVVFRVRFGGYDEWQVDLHLDRLERQLTELEERGGGRGSEARATATVAPPVDRGGQDRVPPQQAPDRMAPAPDRMPPSPDLIGPPTVQVPPVPPMPTGPPVAPGRAPAAMPPHVAPQREPSFGGRYADTGYDGYEPGRHGRAEMTTEIRLPVDQPYAPQPGFGGQPGPATGPSGAAGPAGPGGPAGFGGAASPLDGAAGSPGPSGHGPAGRGPAGRAAAGAGGSGGHGGFGSPTGAVPGYQGRSGAPSQEYGVPAEYRAGEYGTGEYGGRADYGNTSAYPASSGTPGGMHLTGDAARVDQLRRTFQLRRFGSGYDRAQVDRLFDAVVASLAGRGPGGVSEKDLDPSGFALVPGGYFEAEVNAALREVRDLISRRR